jgi:hypothetical protein
VVKVWSMPQPCFRAVEGAERTTAKSLAPSLLAVGSTQA